MEKFLITDFSRPRKFLQRFYRAGAEQHFMIFGMFMILEELAITDFIGKNTAIIVYRQNDFPYPYKTRPMKIL